LLVTTSQCVILSVLTGGDAEALLLLFFICDGAYIEWNKTKCDNYAEIIFISPALC